MNTDLCPARTNIYVCPIEDLVNVAVAFLDIVRFEVHPRHVWLLRANDFEADVELTANIEWNINN